MLRTSVPLLHYCVGHGTGGYWERNGGMSLKGLSVILTLKLFNMLAENVRSILPTMPSRSQLIFKDSQFICIQSLNAASCRDMQL